MLQASGHFRDKAPTIKSRHIPRPTRYEFTAAGRHTLEVGVGLTVQSEAKQIRGIVEPAKIYHLLDFITSSSIVQDLPFGRKTLTLSSGTKIDIPNVIRTVLPSRLIKQHNQYCSEENYSTLVPYAFLEFCLRNAWRQLERLYRGQTATRQKAGADLMIYYRFLTPWLNIGLMRL